MNLQIQFPTTDGEPTLSVHADNGHHEIACGQAVLDLTDPAGIRHQAVLTPVDKDVSCLKCKRFVGIATPTETIARAQAEQRAAVELARAEGDPWSMIAMALGTSPQAAHERFAKELLEHPTTLSKSDQRAAAWHRLFVDQKAEFRVTRGNIKKMDGLSWEIKWPDGLTIEIDVDKIGPNDWTMESRSTDRPSRPIVLTQLPWGNLVMESYDLIERWRQLDCGDVVTTSVPTQQS
jgi:hypothetical protein